LYFYRKGTSYEEAEKENVDSTSPGQEWTQVVKVNASVHYVIMLSNDALNDDSLR